jgi:hypothetical protein
METLTLPIASRWGPSLSRFKARERVGLWPRQQRFYSVRPS